MDIDGSGPMLFYSIPWEEWKDEIETVFLHECSLICTGAFRGFKNLRDVTVFEEELKEIGPSAFEGCVSLKSFDYCVRGELQKASDCAFRNCICLVKWNADVAVVGQRAFENCSNLDVRGYAVGTEEIGAYAFATTVIRSVTVPYDPEKILPLQARQFFGADIGELRVPVEYRDALQGDSWKDGHEITDPVFGQLYCARHTYGHGAEVMAYLGAIHEKSE